VLGCVDPVGEAGGDIARAAALKRATATVPGVQINRFCASGLDAVNFAAAQIMSGQHDMTIGGGVESMSRVGIGASGGAWPMDPSIAVPAYFMPQGVSADLIATKYGFSRDDVDAYAVREPEARREGLGRGPLQEFGGAGEGRQRPHHPGQGRAHAADTTMQSLAQLQPSFVQMGEMGGFDAVAIQSHPEIERVNYVHHAGNSSGIVDGAGAVLLGSKEAGAKHGLKPRARIRAFANIGSEPAMMLTGPVDVTEKVLERSGMKKSDIDLFELNEAFASVVLRYMQAFDIDNAKINVNGGAIALGHPLGATGAMILGTVLDELERTQQVDRAGDAVHRRRHGHRDDHRAGVSRRVASKAKPVPTKTRRAHAVRRFTAEWWARHERRRLCPRADEDEGETSDCAGFKAAAPPSGQPHARRLFESGATTWPSRISNSRPTPTASRWSPGTFPAVR
jgi:acetyl-CoA C-acetyltransferase